MSCSGHRQKASFGPLGDRLHKKLISSDEIANMNFLRRRLQPLFLKDLGVVIDEKLTFRDHMHDKINKAYATLGIIKRNFNYLTIIIIIIIIRFVKRQNVKRLPWR